MNQNFEIPKFIWGASRDCSLEAKLNSIIEGAKYCKNYLSNSDNQSIKDKINNILKIAEMLPKREEIINHNGETALFQKNIVTWDIIEKIYQVNFLARNGEKIPIGILLIVESYLKVFLNINSNSKY